MNKADLIDAIAKKAEMTKKDAGAALDAIIESISASLAKGEKVTSWASAPLMSESARLAQALTPHQG